jgi:predicted dienelactone hydrolase
MKLNRCGPILAVLAAGVVLTAAASETPPASPADAKPAAATYTKDPGPLEVETVKYDWTDPVRNRQVPVKIYYPKAGQGAYPVIIFSHGLGGSRDGYEYLGRYWASHGYVSVHVQHVGSDTAVWKDATEPLAAMRQAAADARNSINRPLDIRFAIDQVTKAAKEEGPLKGRLDMDRVGMAGHSFGAFTTMAVAGQVFITPQGRELGLPDPRIKAAIAMSSPAPKNRDELDKAFAKIRIPVFHMTGTKDDSPIGDTTAKERRLPYDHSKGSDQYLVTFEGGDHMIFSGRGRVGEATGKDAEFQSFICMASLAFWDAYLKGDAKAKAWLSDGGFAAALGKEGKFEHKAAKVADKTP